MQKLTWAQILDLRKLFQRSERYSRKEYLIEGEKVIQEAVLSGVIIKKLIVTEEFLVSGKDYLASLGVSENSYGVVPEESMQQLSGMVTAPGVMAVVAMITFSLEDVQKEKIACLIDVADPGNLGTMIRTAEWFGVSHFLISSQTVDPYNDKTIRAAMGSLFRATIFQSQNIIDDLKKLKSQGVAVISTDSHAGSEALPTTTPWCAVMGSESHGVPEEIQQLADYKYKIAGQGPTESLNVATSFGITLFDLQGHAK